MHNLVQELTFEKFREICTDSLEKIKGENKEYSKNWKYPKIVSIEQDREGVVFSVTIKYRDGNEGLQEEINRQLKRYESCLFSITSHRQDNSHVSYDVNQDDDFGLINQDEYKVIYDNKDAYETEFGF